VTKGPIREIKNHSGAKEIPLKTNFIKKKTLLNLEMEKTQSVVSNPSSRGNCSDKTSSFRGRMSNGLRYKLKKHGREYGGNI
jgi:hypothetical protein